MIIDNHVHVGWYTDGYHSPQEIWNAAKSSGIDEIAVSSTSICAEKYKLVVREMRELLRMGGDKVHPVLWLTPRMLRTYGIRYMLHSKINWEGVKLHWLAHPEWGRNRQILQQALDIVKQLDVPLLLHSGEQDCCQPHLFVPICKELKSTIVLAHGRPLEQTILLLKEYPNTMVDTAFMPAEHVIRLVAEGYEDRIAFGTDTPIQMVYDTATPISLQIKKQVDELTAGLPNLTLSKILSRNLFK